VTRKRLERDCQAFSQHTTATFSEPAMRRKVERLFESAPPEQTRQECLELTVQKLKISEGVGALSRQISALLS